MNPDRVPTIYLYQIKLITNQNKMSLLFKDAPLPGSRLRYPITGNKDKPAKTTISNHAMYTTDGYFACNEGPPKQKKTQTWRNWYPCLINRPIEPHWLKINKQEIDGEPFNNYYHGNQCLLLFASDLNLNDKQSWLVLCPVKKRTNQSQQEQVQLTQIENQPDK